MTVESEPVLANGGCVAGDGPREFPLMEGCLRLFTVSKSGALTGPLTVAEVRPGLVWAVNRSSKFWLGAFAA